MTTAMNIPDIFNTVQGFLYPMPNFKTQQQINRFYKDHIDILTHQLLVPPTLDEYRAKMNEWKTAYTTQQELRKEIKELEGYVANKVKGKVRSSQQRLKELGVKKNTRTGCIQYPYSILGMNNAMNWFANGQNPYDCRGVGRNPDETMEDFRTRADAFTAHIRQAEKDREANEAIFFKTMKDGDYLAWFE